MPYRDLDRPPLDARALQAALVVPGGFWTDVVVTPSTASTNADLADAARAGAAEGAVHTTDHQVAGRGRLDRTGVPEARASRSRCCCADEVPAGRWVWLPLLVGLAVAATVEECGVEPGLKWPNDVEVDGRKIAGILLERVDTRTARPPWPAWASTSRCARRKARRHRDVVAARGRRDRPTVVLRLLLRNLEALYRAWRGAAGDPAPACASRTCDAA